MEIKRFFLLVFLMLLCLNLVADIYINEVVQSNQTIIADYYGEYGDWIELYNNSELEFDLTDYFLTDDSDELNQWQFPAMTIPAHGFMLIWADSNDEIDPDGFAHTNFKIGSQETITLSSPDTILVDTITLPDFPSNYSYGRATELSSEWYIFPVPTPSLPNSGGYQGLLDNPQPSHQAGFYSTPFDLTFTNIEDGASLYYTLDGSEPIIGNPNTFIYDPQDALEIQDRSSEPNQLSQIRTTVEGSSHWTDQWIAPSGLVKKGTVIRCKVMKPNHLSSQELYLTYFVGQEFINDFTDIPLVSLITDPVGYFDDYEGIYVPGRDENGNPITSSLEANYQQGWEKHTFLQLWEANRNEGFTAQGLSEIHGSASARLMRKGVRIGFKGSFGYDDLTYDLFDENITESYNSIILRASGQDAQHTIFRDGVGQMIFEKQGLATSPFKPVVLFINGEYWGIHNFRERSDEEYAQRLYGVDVDEMDFLENRGAANPEERVGTRARYSSILNYVKNNDLNLPENYQSFSEMVDMQNFINYYIAQVFVANSDWPSYNVRMWRHKTELTSPDLFYNPDAINPYEDGRFRWMIFDLDQALGRFHNYNSNTLQAAATVGSWNDNFYLLFRKLIGATDANGNQVTDNNGLYSNGSDAFRQDFVNTFCDALNTYLLPERTTDLVASTQNIYSSYMEEHIARWGFPANVTTWNGYVNGVTDFLTNRPDVIKTHLANKFQLTSGTSDLTIQINNDQMGYVVLNTLKIGSNAGFETGPFTGEYFNGIPLQITAIANPGYRFVGWNQLRNPDNPLSLILTENTSLTAVFEVDNGEFTGDAMNPQAWDLNSGLYQMLSFSAETPAGQYPENMRFLMSSLPDPNFGSPLTTYYSSPYNMESKSRINGLDDSGISFINTGSSAENGLETTGYVAATVLGLKSTGLTDIKLNYTVETIEQNSRVYGLALFYRSGISGEWQAIIHNQENVNYIASDDGHTTTYFSIALPSELDNNSYFQLCWRYHYMSGSSGSRAKLRLDDILVYTENFDDVSNIQINEVMSDNELWEHEYAFDDFDERSDWIELYNSGNQSVNLLGAYLSDDEDNLGKWLIPQTSLQANDFLIIRASSENKQTPNQELHTNFSIKASGEALFLTDFQGDIIESMEDIEIPTDTSYGRVIDNPTEWTFFPIPTPGSANLAVSISAPTNVEIHVTATQLYITWESVPGVSHYKIYGADTPAAETWDLIQDNILNPAYSINLEELVIRKFYKIIAVQ
ncbi:CotH kinase family protein [bacterium]|nr:CotH kinase family protein [bacterium]